MPLLLFSDNDVLTVANFLAEYDYLTPNMIVKIFNNEFIEKMKDLQTNKVKRERVKEW